MGVLVSRLHCRLALFVIMAVLARGLPAHHSVAGQFDMSKEVEWTGVISKVDWINPHTYIYLDVTDANGSTVTWQLATAPTAMLRKAGLTKAMIIGDGAKVMITGLLTRDGTKHLGWVNKITYPDGHFYQLARSPR
ncbi:MAG: hypothetical protein HW386_1109 [Gammaproteobacteria bacterium]|nr:hypothetical protein [Gammaproteobacteria bacterium]